MFSVMRINNHIHFIYQKKSLKIIWNYCLYLKMRINILCTSKILIDLCLTKPSIKIRNIFACIVCNVLAQKMCLMSTKKNCIVINGTQAIKMPSKDNNILQYNHYHKQLPAPFVIYADFEALTEQIHGCQQNNDKSFTDAYQKHTDCGYGYKVVCCYDDKYTKDVQYYRGENAVYKFLEQMLEEESYCKNIVKCKFNKPLKMTNVDEEEFQKADKCHICGISYNDKDIRVRDHCHITGLFRGSAHQDCNLSFKLTGKIPVVFHNLRGYDSHFIMQQIDEIVKKHTYVNGKGEECQMNVNTIPNNMENIYGCYVGK